MALSEKQIRELWEDHNPMQGIASFARAVEAEVQKQDTALIRQMEEALELARRLVLVGGASTHDEINAMFTATSAARARLEGKP